jgi:hypothetical protein
MSLCNYLDSFEGISQVTLKFLWVFDLYHVNSTTMIISFVIQLNAAENYYLFTYFNFLKYVDF